jgi:hypothetical protein
MKKSIGLLVALVFVSTSMSAHAGTIYTSPSAFNAAIAGIDLAWEENFSGFANGSHPANPTVIAGGNAQITSPYRFNNINSMSPYGNAWWHYYSTGTATIGGVAGDPLLLKALSFNYSFSGGYGGQWNFHTSTGIDYGPAMPPSNANPTWFLGWIGSSSEDLIMAQTLPRTGQHVLDNIRGYRSAPIPATVLLLGSGLVALAGFRRKNKKA